MAFDFFLDILLANSSKVLEKSLFRNFLFFINDIANHFNHSCLIITSISHRVSIPVQNLNSGRFSHVCSIECYFLFYVLAGDS